MGDLRFEFAAIAVFAAAFVEISFGMPWASKGFSVAAVNSTPSRLKTLAPPVEPPPIVEARTEPVAPKPPPIPGLLPCLLNLRRFLHRPLTPQRASTRATISPRQRCRPPKPMPARRASGWPRRCSSSRLRPICASRTSHRRRRRMRAFTTLSRLRSRPATSAPTNFPLT
jgi:hypothetical protein